MARCRTAWSPSRSTTRPSWRIPWGAWWVVQRKLDEARGAKSFLRGHTEDVTCVAASNDGRVLCTGQDAPLGVASPAVLWDLEDACQNLATPGGRGTAEAPQDPEPARQWRGPSDSIATTRSSSRWARATRNNPSVGDAAEPKVCVRAALDTARCGAFCRMTRSDSSREARRT